MQRVVRPLLLVGTIVYASMVIMAMAAEEPTLATSRAPLDIYGPVLQSPDGSQTWASHPDGITPTYFIKAGQQYVIFVNATDLVPEFDNWPGTDVSNSAMIVRVSDYYSNDIELLAWTRGIEKDGNPMVMAVSWTPDQASKYQVSTFVVTGLENPIMLSSGYGGYYYAKE